MSSYLVPSYTILFLSSGIYVRRQISARCIGVLQLIINGSLFDGHRRWGKGGKVGEGGEGGGKTLPGVGVMKCAVYVW